ncbi:MAG TPA: helix-turn-helix domain-containing protein [Verrucomicrobiales bacterium]|jgi:DNA-binding XRE family transcriptional regulator|nr:helix-turn-helix domain-containing protein [Verrucomicrobiales bacterium]HIL68710.1 helix-turn-helix domain-containing protein [Verrucomicrobiota bacterium]
MKKKGTDKKTTEAFRILHNRYVLGRPEAEAMLEEERSNGEIARKITQLRDQAELTQAQLAKLIGTSRTVISRLEDSDYDGHSLSMLKRVAAALNRRVQIRFVKIKKELQV